MLLPFAAFEFTLAISANFCPSPLLSTVKYLLFVSVAVLHFRSTFCPFGIAVKASNSTGNEFHPVVLLPNAKEEKEVKVEGEEVELTLPAWGVLKLPKALLPPISIQVAGVAVVFLT